MVRCALGFTSDASTLPPTPQTGLPGFSGGKKTFEFLKNIFYIPISKKSSDFASFCVADGLKINLSY